MKKSLIIAAIAFLLVGCNKPSDEQIIKDVQTKITTRVKTSYGGCENWTFLKESTAPEFKNAFLRHCDRDFKPDSLKFSDMKVNRHKAFTVVCGVVSGNTDLSKQGIRFVQFWDRDDVAELQSKYSGLRMKDLLESPAQRYRTYYRDFCNGNK